MYLIILQFLSDHCHEVFIITEQLGMQSFSPKSMGEMKILKVTIASNFAIFVKLLQ